MKNIIIIGLLISLITPSFAEYNLDRNSSNYENNAINTMISQASEKTVHQKAMEQYIRDNISELSEVDPVLGGNWYVVSFEWISDSDVTVIYEDGHIQEEMTIDIGDITINPMQTSQPICTLQYAPVCAQVQVQCIKAPCYPVQETFGNACQAGKNKILYSGKCESHVRTELYGKYEEHTVKLRNMIQNVPQKTLQNLVQKLDILISKTKLLKIDVQIIRERITKYVFLKNLLQEEIEMR